jgi:glutamate--cysteine ligase
VEYVEVRLMDLDPFTPVGITPPTMRFLDLFLLHCLLADSPPDTPSEIAEIKRNQQRVASRGREPGLVLERAGREVPFAEWGSELLRDCEPVAAALDTAHGGAAHRDALAAAHNALKEPASTPSARVLHAMERNHGKSFIRFVVAESLAHRGTIMGIPLAPEVEEEFELMAHAALAKQRQIEAADRVDFETYRQKYLSPDLLLVT